MSGDYVRTTPAQAAAAYRQAAPIDDEGDTARIVARIRVIANDQSEGRISRELVHDLAGRPMLTLRDIDFGLTRPNPKLHGDAAIALLTKIHGKRDQIASQDEVLVEREDGTPMLTRSDLAKAALISARRR